MLRLIPFLVAQLLLLGCDGGVELKGVVYRWVDAPGGATSRIIVDQPWALPAQLIPLAGVQVTIYGSTADAKKGVPEIGDWQGKSNADGSFEVGGSTAPGSHTMAVAAKLPGCRDAIGSFVNEGDSGKHTVAIILVCPERR